MSYFIDTKNRKWILNITIGDVKNILRETKVNLHNNTSELLTLLGKDISLLTDVLWVLVKKQAKEKKISRQQFYDSLSDDVIDSVVNALKESVSKALMGFEGQGLTVKMKNGKVYVSLDEKLLFKSGSTTVDPKGVQALQKLSKVLEGNRDVNIMIEGHTDAIGGEKANDRLGTRRAAAVKDYLIKKWHVTPDRIMTRSFGEEQPVALNATADGRAQNRRAEVFRVTLTTK
jgi:outer membrane protein OmpA-like peptidoglycan-associated protein